MEHEIWILFKMILEEIDFEASMTIIFPLIWKIANILNNSYLHLHVRR